VPISSKEVDEKEISKKCIEIKKRLEKIGVRVHFDNRDNYNPGWKYNHWQVIV
jgi:prolyl-tRNA synthetase